MSDHTPSQQQRNGEHVLYCFNDDAITYGSRVNASDLKFDIVLEADKVVRLINPSSDPRLSWQRIRNHCHIDWGDGHVTKWYARVINSGRFNRDSEFIPQHEYKNANVGDRFTITVKCREPLVPIYCRLDKIWGEFPEDIYRVKSSRDSDDDMGLFGECYHIDYPELSLLNKHRDTVNTVGADLLVNWRNTDMTNMFSHFIALREVPIGFFKTIMGNVLSYEKCFFACDSLEKVDPGLLGLGNNTVRVLDSMFEGCLSLKNTIYLQNSESLISVKSMYKDCHKLNICDERLFNYCPNIVHADRIFMNDRMLGTLGPKVLKFSLNMETISEACKNTGMTQTYISIGKMNKLYNAREMYYGCDKLATITDGFFQNTGINASKEVNFDKIFMSAGDRTHGCVVPSKLCQPIGNIARLKPSNHLWFHNFWWRGEDFPADLFRDTFKSGPNRKMFEAHDLISYAAFPEATSLEIRNKLFTGNQENLIKNLHTFAGVGEINNIESDGACNITDRKPITYFNRDMFIDMVNVECLRRAFAETKLEFKFYEDIFRENKKLNDLTSMFQSVTYKFNKFPIDYLVRTTSDDSDVDMSKMFEYSNIRVYRPIHWSATKNVRYKMNDIVKGNSEGVSVPVEFMLDGRTQVDSNYEHEYEPRGIVYVYQANSLNNNTVTLKLESGTYSNGKPMETHLTPADIDWGDGNTETWRPTTTSDTLSHNYHGAGCYKIVIKSERTPYFIKQLPVLGTEDETYPILEVRGEFPYACFDEYSSEDGMTCFMAYYHLDQSVYRIVHANGSMFKGALYQAVKTYHPYLLKYDNNHNIPGRIFEPYSLSAPIWGSKALANDIDDPIIYPRFYENCVSADKLSYTLNVNTKMIPDDAFPKNLLHNENVDMKYMGGMHAGYQDTKYKFHIKPSLYRDWMIRSLDDLNQSELYLSYPVLPYNSGWISKLPYQSPLYEKLTFVVRDITIDNIGLERLAAGNIGEIRIEIFTDSGIIDKKINIANDADLNGCIGSLTGNLNVINIYSKIPLWLDNHNIINEVRGVIPECNLNKTFKTLAPNVTRISDTLFYRLTNKSFNEMFKDCAKLEQIPPHLFLCNTKAESFISCFENCTSLDRVPDYFLVCYDHDIDCTYMFKGCTNIKHIYRPISDSVLGRVKVTDMFLGCQTTAFELNKNMNEQALDGVWYTGDAKLVKADVPANWQRATIEIPTLFTGYHYDSYNPTNGISKITDNDIAKASASIYVADPINEFSKSTVIPKPRELGKAFGYRFSHIHFTHLNCISMSDLCELTRYTINMRSLQSAVSGDLFYPHKNAMFKDENLIISKDFMFWNEYLSDLWAVFEGSTVYAPFHSSFLKMNDRLSSLKRLFYGAHFRSIDDVDVGGILGKNVLNDFYLGAKVRTGELNLDVLLDRNIELMCEFGNTFNAIKGNFNGDRLHLGTCEPYNIDWMFANVKSLEDGNYRVDPDAGYPFTNYTLENVLNNPNLGRYGDYSEFTLSDFGFAAYNDKITSDTGLLKKLTSFKHKHLSDIRSGSADNKEAVHAIYLYTNLTEIPNDCFESMDPSVPIILSDIFAGTKIKSLPRINHLVNICDTWHLFFSCKNLTNPIIPENYIKSDYQGEEVSLDAMFAGSNARVENQFIDITSTATFNVKESLRDCISTIGDDPEIFRGIRYNTDPANHSLVNATGKVKNAFHQTIQTKKNMVPVHIEYFDDHTTSIKNVNDMEISWGDGSINEKHHGKVDFAALRHTYDKPGEYEVQIRCNEFPAYVETNSYDSDDKITKFVGKFVHGDATKVIKPMDQCFGNYVEEFEDGLFNNLSNIESIEQMPSTFSGQVKIRRLPNELLKPFINLKRLNSTFQGCIELSSIPEDMIKYNTNLEHLDYTFNGCGLTTIPAKLFETNRKLKVLECVFHSNKLRNEGIPNNLFNPLISLETIIDPFGKNPDIIITNDERWNNLFISNTNLIRISGIASTAHLTGIPINILKGLNKLTRIDSLFEFKGDTNINLNDIDLTVDNAIIKNASNTLIDCSGIFKNRKNIVKINSGLFDSIPNLTNLKDAFRGSGLRDIPKYIVNDIHNAQNIDCSGMFADCASMYTIADEPISQNATRIVNTKDMLLNVRSLYCEPEIFYGVHPKDGEFNSGYIWNTAPVTQSIAFNHETPNGYYVDDFRLFPFYEWQKTEFEPIYIEKIRISAERGKETIAEKIITFKKTFRSLNELLNGTVVNAKYIVENEFQATRANDGVRIEIYTNKPLRLQYVDPTKKNARYFWNGAFGFITRTKHNSYDQSKWSFNNMTKNDEDTLFDLDEGSIFSNDGYSDRVTDYNIAGFKYLQNEHNYLYSDLVFKNMINIDYYLADTNYWNVAIRGENDLGEMIDRYPAYLPRFSGMPNVRYANKVFFNTFFTNYSEDISNYRDHPSIIKWEPFISNHNIEEFGYLYYNTNIPKLFKLNFDAPNGVSSITHMFAKTTQHYDIPFDYFNGLTKLKATTITDDTGTYEGAFFMDWIFGKGSKQTTIKDKTNNKMLMSEWRPDFNDGINLFIRGLFDGSLIPNEERLEFIDKLPLIHEYSHKRFRKVYFDCVELVNADYSGDITPFLRNGKFLDLSNVNCEYLTLENLLQSVTKANKTATLTNIPKGAVVLPDKATTINLNNMFKGCTAASDVTDISQCFVYNGTANISYQDSGLQLASKNTK